MIRAAILLAILMLIGCLLSLGESAPVSATRPAKNGDMEQCGDGGPAPDPTRAPAEYPDPKPPAPGGP